MKVKIRKSPRPNSRMYCEQCPARTSDLGYSTTVVRSSGPEYAHLLIVGEAPGAEEDDQGIPFVGKTGRYLRQHVEAFDFGSVRYTNVVRCRPPENKTPTGKIVGVCVRYLMDEIASVKPKAVLLMGNTPLKAVLGESGITSWRGTPFHRDGIMYMPTYHPSYVLRQLNEGSGNTYDEWISDIEAVAIHLGKSTTQTQVVVPNKKFIVADTTQRLIAMKKVLLASPVISFDCEIGNFGAENPDSRILCVSFCCENGAWVVPVKHPESPWIFDWDHADRKHPHRAGIDPRAIVTEILSNCKVVGHNLKFDIMQICMNLGIWVAHPVADTMLLSSLIDSKRGIHGLKRLAAIHLWMADYDAELERYKASHPECNPARGGSYANFPASVLYPYAAYDAIATFHLWKVLNAHEHLTDAEVILHDQLLMPATSALAAMEVAGIALDADLVHRYSDIYELAVARTYHDLITGSPSLRKFTLSRRASGKKSDAGFLPNLRSSQQVGTWVFDYMGLESLKKTDGGSRSVDAEALAPYIEHYEDIALLSKYRMYDSIWGKYLRPPRDGEWQLQDGRVHSTYRINGAITGRLSSSKPNMQNIPTPEKEPDTLLAYLPVKNVFTATWRDKGGVLLQADYSGMELRVFASLANCQSMIQAFEEGTDIHTLVTSQLYGIPIEDVTKEMRYRGKWVNWTLLYGGDAHTLSSLYGVPMHDAERLVSGYYTMFPEILHLQKEIVATAKKQGYYETVFGRRIYATWLQDRNEAKAAAERRTFLNFPIQSAASDTLLIALCIIQKLRDRAGLRSLMVNTVHDSILFDVYPGELDQLAKMAQNVMEDLPRHAAKHMPKLSFKWLRVPLVADLETGTHYGALEKYP